MPWPTALCFMPESINWSGVVLVQWPMGLLSLLWRCVVPKGGEVISLLLSRYDTPTKQKKTQTNPGSNQNNDDRQMFVGVMINLFIRTFYLREKKESYLLK